MNKNIFNRIGRILLIIIILFFTLFSLDAGSFLGWIIHMIPSFLLIIILLISWKWNFVGGIILILVGLLTIFFFDTYKSIISLLIITIPMIICGTIFMLAKKTKS
ncbi:MAG: hypothetical protein KKF89_02760 [Nanoarchaeota archaeon]|nr:hypothetical protein [Nanoarchaeota archaeon]MBU1854614.1 hypothetical protein [Nanoarchaeota archaeon]